MSAAGNRDLVSFLGARPRAVPFSMSRDQGRVALRSFSAQSDSRALS